MADKPDAIEALFSDSGAFDEITAVTALQPYLTIQRSTNKIFFKESSLSVVKKILAYALAKKLLATKKHVPTDMITAIEFQKATGINKGTIDPSFKTLKDKGFLVGKLEYELPAHKIPSVIQMLNTNQK